MTNKRSRVGRPEIIPSSLVRDIINKTSVKPFGQSTQITVPADDVRDLAEITLFFDRVQRRVQTTNSAEGRSFRFTRLVNPDGSHSLIFTNWRRYSDGRLHETARATQEETIINTSEKFYKMLSNSIENLKSQESYSYDQDRVLYVAVLIPLPFYNPKIDFPQYAFDVFLTTDKTIYKSYFPTLPPNPYGEKQPVHASVYVTPLYSMTTVYETCPRNLDQHRKSQRFHANNPPGQRESLFLPNLSENG